MEQQRLDLDALEVSDIMVHRTAMRALNAGDPPEEIVKAVLESPYTRMPLWAGSVDNIVGVVHAKDLLRALAEPGVEPRNLDITRVAQKPWFVPDTTTLKEQLAAFLRRQEHFATVVDEYGDILTRLLSAPNIASKEWIYGQYDHSVQINTVVYPGQGDATVLRVRESKTNKGIAAKADCNSRYCYLDPFMGAQIAIAECARNLVCVGAEPGGVTDCLCFGNPEKPDVMWQFVRAVEGMGAACRALDVPITGGNVSLYNETDGRAVLPTPVIGVVGLIEDADRMTEHAANAEESRSVR